MEEEGINIVMWLENLTMLLFECRLKVKIIGQIAEGGFSIVYEAREYGGGKGKAKKKKKRYALKRMVCADEEVLKKCRDEAQVHESLRHPNLLPLLGIKFERQDKLTLCYMLFPFLSSSLRDEINQRGLLLENAPPQDVKPFHERELLEIFSGCVDGVAHMHERGLAHRDIKVENVMFDSSGKPVLIDYGSVGPVHIALRTRTDVLSLVDGASLNSTVSYRAPELFEGGTRYGQDEPDVDGRIDVWSLGCLLFAMMYGCSPFECEFRPNGIKVVECSHLRILGTLPRPPRGSHLDGRYNKDILDFVEWMLTQDRMKRPNIQDVSLKLDALLKTVGGTWCWRKQNLHRIASADSQEMDAFVEFV